MLEQAGWAGLGVAATLLGGFIAHKTGRIQITLMRDAHALSIKKATPSVNSRVSITASHPRPDITRYTIYTEIYNDGDLRARNLEGQWKLTTTEGLLPTSKIIRANSLPAFLPLKLNHEIGGNIADIWCKPQIIVQVDIDLNYLGFENKPEHYKATYDYDFQHREMILRDSK